MGVAVLTGGVRVGVNDEVEVGVWEGTLVLVGVEVAVEVAVKVSVGGITIPVGVEVSEGGISVWVGVGEASVGVGVSVLGGTGVSVGRIERCTRRPMLIDPWPVTQKRA